MMTNSNEQPMGWESKASRKRGVVIERKGVKV
jgi:hypothetical protein